MQSFYRPSGILLLLPSFILASNAAAPNSTTAHKQGANIETTRSHGAVISVRIAEDGRALMPVRVAANASPGVRKNAKTLIDYLKRISGAQFELQTAASPLEPETAGITLGLTTQVAGLAGTLTNNDPATSEDYILRTYEKGILLSGASELGVEHAVWDMLYRLGYRQFFPGEKWDVVPDVKTLQLAVNTREHPAYLVRRIWFGHRTPPEKVETYPAWGARNRAEAPIVLDTGHAYGKIIDRNKAAFDAHPEYYGLLNGKRYSGQNAKLCISNTALRELVVADAQRQFDQDPQLQSLSMDPSDGGNWCECPECAKLGSVTDRVVLLANQVAAAVDKKYPGKLISMYAYNQHSPPPTIAVHPNVIVSIATSFIRGGYTLDQLLDGWHKQAKTLGIREYYGIFAWDRHLPGQAHAGDFNYLKTTIPRFNAQGVRFMSAESTYAWGENGLGYYIAARLMWDPTEAAHVEEMVNDFLDKAYGPVREPMAEWYRLIDSSKKPLVSTDLIGRMYRQLDQALRMTNDPPIRARLHELAIYTRYCEVYTHFAASKGQDRRAGFEQILRMTWRSRFTEMFQYKSAWVRLTREEKEKNAEIPLPPEASDTLPEAKNTWKQDPPYTVAEIEKFISDGIAHNPLLDFQVVSFSDDLVPATPLALCSDKAGSLDYVRGPINFYTWIDKAPASIGLQMRAGLVYNNRGAARATLYSRAEAEVGAAADKSATPPDKQVHGVQLRASLEGLQRIEVSDGIAGTEVTWREGMPMVIESSLANKATIFKAWSLYFYVPKGTRVVGGYGDGEVKVLDGSGHLVKALSITNNYWSVPVPAGQDGKLWRFDQARGEFKLMTVPPYLARSAAELLLPAEVVKADTIR